jgi:hypothetical protein
MQLNPYLTFKGQCEDDQLRAAGLTERGHPVRQRAQHAHYNRTKMVRAARSGGQDVRDPNTREKS